MNIREVEYKAGQQIEVRRDGGEWQKVEMDSMDDCGYLDGLDADFDEYRIVDGYINVAPDGLLTAAFHAAKRLADGGVAMLDTLNEPEFTEFAMELFRALTAEAAVIDTSSWLPHNKAGDGDAG